MADGIKNLRFGDEVSAINRTSKVLDRLGVKSQVVLVHQGDSPLANNPPNGCGVTSGPGFTIAKNVSASVDAVFLAHSHQQYNCVVDDPEGNPRPVIQGLSFGRLLSVVDLQIDPRSKDVIRSRTVAENEIVTRTVTPDAPRPGHRGRSHDQGRAAGQPADRHHHRRPAARCRTVG